MKIHRYLRVNIGNELVLNSLEQFGECLMTWLGINRRRNSQRKRGPSFLHSRKNSFRGGLCQEARRRCPQFSSVCRTSRTLHTISSCVSHHTPMSAGDHPHPGRRLDRIGSNCLPSRSASVRQSVGSLRNTNAQSFFVSTHQAVLMSGSDLRL